MKFFPTDLYQDPIPNKVRVLILGGGIHGVGMLHDLVTRGWKDCLLVEKNNLASGTSSKSTKLIHGGLRYLKNPTDYLMVRQALLERRLLLDLTPDLVKPIELCLPIKKSTGMPAWMIQSGLCLYDVLSGKKGIHSYRSLSKTEAKEKIPTLDVDGVSKVFSFWDGQTDDLALVERIAHSAKKLGGSIAERTKIVSLSKDAEGWVAHIEKPDGSRATIKALYVINCLGSWANEFLEKNQISPAYEAINNKGSHLLLPDMNLKAGLFLQTKQDSRVFFLLPWKEKTLLGTTESLYTQDLDHVHPSEEEASYLLEQVNAYLTQKLTLNDVQTSFAGLRWLTKQGSKLSSASREFSLSEHHSGPGMLITIYGGKLTSYRSLCEKIGDKLTNYFGDSRKSGTDKKEHWLTNDPNKRSRPVLDRF